MIALRFGAPNTFDLVGDMPLVLAWMRHGYKLFVGKEGRELVAWSNAPSPKALRLSAGDVAGLIDRELIEVETAASTDSTSCYRLTAAGRAVGRAVGR